MSRSGYDEDYDERFPNSLELYRSSVAQATRGKRGQEFFKALVEALDAMPEKALIAEELETPEGAVCAIGALGRAKNIPMSDLDPEDAFSVGKRFNIAECLTREVVFMNDEVGFGIQSPQSRWARMRAWAQSQISSVS